MADSMRPWLVLTAIAGIGAAVWLLRRYAKRRTEPAPPVHDLPSQRRFEPTLATPPSAPVSLPAPIRAPEPPAALAFPAEIVEAMPRRVVFLDVETTGIHSTDRVVTLGALTLETTTLREGILSVMPLHLVFDPTRKSHPEAERVHGWPDWTLRHQDLFSDHADAILALIQSADLLVAHNASFDMRFINREMEFAGIEMPEKAVECTMQGWRQKGLARASLSAVCAHLGLSRAGDTHGALEDAGLAMQAWLALRIPGLRFAPMLYPSPSNFRKPPPLPEGPLPRRSSRKRKAN